MPGEKTTVVGVRLTRGQVAALDAYQAKKHPTESRSTAAKLLLREALQQQFTERELYEITAQAAGIEVEK